MLSENQKFDHKMHIVNKVESLMEYSMIDFKSVPMQISNNLTLTNNCSFLVLGIF